MMPGLPPRRGFNSGSHSAPQVQSRAHHAAGGASTVLITIGLILLVVAAGVAALLLTGLPASQSTTSSQSGTCCSTNVVRIGYFANINHGQALVGLFNGDYQKALGPSVQVQLTRFTAGPTEMTALLGGRLDMAYVGPSPAVAAYIQSEGAGLKIVAGASDGGALFVVTNASGIATPSAGSITSQLVNRTFMAPQLGNTQDVALRSYLESHHLVPGINVTVTDASPPNIVAALAANKADGAWVPQPYGSLILAEAKAHLFLDERDLWPNGEFSTAELVVSSAFLTAHPDVVERVLMAHVNETVWIGSHQDEASVLMNQTIAQQTGLGLTPGVLSSSLATLTYTYDPLASSVEQQAQAAYALGFLGSSQPDLKGLIDTSLLNQVLAQLGLQPVTQ